MNYSELVAAAKAYADNSDIEVANNIDMFILLTEARINRLLKTREQSTRAFVITVADRAYYALPPDYSGMRDVQLNSDVPSADHSISQFHYLNPEQMNVKSQAESTDLLFYTVIGSDLQIHPTQDDGLSIELVYYQRVPNLNGSDTTNWCSLKHPDIYLAGMTGEISLFNKDYEIADGWFDRLGSAIDELDNADIKERWAGQPMVTRAG